MGETMANKTEITAEPGNLEITVTREFDAPRDLVFKAHTDPSLYTQWLGPRELKMTLERFEPRNGGIWRYIHEDKAGNKYAFHGVYHEVHHPRESLALLSLKAFRKPGM